jgi:flagellar basal-body rod protein FlgF
VDPLTITAASGMKGRLESLDMLANNLANTGTSGFKADREAFNLYLSDEATEGPGPAQGFSPMVDKHWTDFGQGTINATGNPADLALSGSGFFVANSPTGPVYTRNGSIRMMPDGALATTEGYRMATVDGQPLKVNPNLPFTVDRDGTVRQQQSTLGQLRIVDVPDKASLAKAGATYFQLNSPTTSLPQSQAEVLQGSLEGSNASTVDAAVRLVNVLRQFETLQKAVQVGSDMNRRAVEDVARVSA